MDGRRERKEITKGERGGEFGDRDRRVRLGNMFGEDMGESGRKRENMGERLKTPRYLHRMSFNKIDTRKAFVIRHRKVVRKGKGSRKGGRMRE